MEKETLREVCEKYKISRIQDHDCVYDMGSSTYEKRQDNIVDTYRKEWRGLEFVLILH